MTRHLMLVLLLATAFAVAKERPQKQPGERAANAQPKAAVTQSQPEPGKAEASTDSKEKTDLDAKASSGAQTKTDEGVQASADQGGKLISTPGGKALGMSILGNQEAPKSLVIVPWKSSELGRAPGVTPLLDDSRQPVDKEVFMRALSYYEIRSGTKQ